MIVKHTFMLQVVRALQKAAGRKARPGSVNAEGGVRLSSLGLAMLMEEKQR